MSTRPPYHLSLLPPSWATQSLDKAKTSGAQLEILVKMKLIGVQEIPLQLHGRAQVSIKLGDEVFVTRVIVADCLTTNVILGPLFLRAPVHN